jgi:general transcription factor 3C polypeptide 5 (transcription factor C subunit 1)
MTDLPRKQRVAPWLHIPQHRIVSVEHPGIVKNVDRAIATLQGNDGIIKVNTDYQPSRCVVYKSDSVSQILNPPKANTPAKLSLRPEDPMSRPVQSLSTGTNNILLKVTVPKWTGRKRKRGTNGPFVMDESESGSAGPDRRPASTRLRSLQDNVGRYTVEPVGRVERTHTFRSIPDFVYSTAGSSFTQKFREHILPFDCKSLRWRSTHGSSLTVFNAQLRR